VVEDRRLEEATAYFRTIAPRASEVTKVTSKRLQFVDCGGNFGNIHCPSCGAVIEVGDWQDWMTEHYEQDRVALTKHAMPCCGALHTLHELAYEWPQGFARCEVWAMNAGIGKLKEEHQARFEAILGCPVRVIYQHR
jgi:hypothetical protein